MKYNKKQNRLNAKSENVNIVALKSMNLMYSIQLNVTVVVEYALYHFIHVRWNSLYSLLQRAQFAVGGIKLDFFHICYHGEMLSGLITSIIHHCSIDTK